ncbi:hypothetical protein [Methanosarcina sp. 1.H.A.2.2]|uniref:hypothetical protein n=1 Tax=Methanosarcina sp. 1.H.A.2.2 TaxID=1483601 RepID=UPI0006217003|nr:hypothetical protein [Methanosarcina sp. 1.H.A.2.2]KKH47838.1 hypothetical protein EO93_09990 [Methanosarcina sp. 1.H.A.2.2]
MLALGKSLGISQKVWEDHEELGYISYYDSNFNRDKAIALNMDLISSFKKEYGDALKCVFRLGDFTVLDINEDISDEKLEEFRKYTEGISTLLFDFSIDKTKLISNEFDEVPNCNQFLYFFSNALLKFLSNNLSELVS